RRRAHLLDPLEQLNYARFKKRNILAERKQLRIAQRRFVGIRKPSGQKPAVFTVLEVGTGEAARCRAAVHSTPTVRVGAGLTRCAIPLLRAADAATATGYRCAIA